MADTLGPHVERLYAVASSPSRRLLAIGGRRDIPPPGHFSTAAKTTLDTAPSLHVLTLPKAQVAFSRAITDADADADAIHALLFASDELLLAGLSTGTIVGWDPSQNDPPRIIHVPAAHRGAVRALATDPMGTYLASAGDDGALRIGRLGPSPGKSAGSAKSAKSDKGDSGAGLHWQELAHVPLSGRPLHTVVIDAQASTVAAAGDDGVVYAVRLPDLSDLADGADIPVRKMPCGQGGVFSLCFLGDGRIAAGCGDGSIHLCFLEGAVDAENRSRDAGHASAVRGLIYSNRLFDSAKRPLPRRLFSISDDGELKAWLLDSGRRPRTVSLSKSPLTAMTLIPAGRGTKAERRGGTLAVVGRSRRLSLITVDERGEPADKYTTVDSRLQALRQDLRASSPQARTGAVAALATLAEDRARSLLDRTLRKDKKPQVRKAAADAIGDTGRRLSRPELRTALDDGDKGVRNAALRALLAIEHDSPVSALTAALASDHADIRIAALTRLPALRDASPLVPGLIADRLSDDAAKVRAKALDALYELDRGGMEPARTAMARGPADIRKAVLLRLGRDRQVAAADTGAAAAAPSESDSETAATAPGQALLEAALDDAEQSVRELAFLISIGARAHLAAQVRAVDPTARRALDELERAGTFADPLTDLGAAAAPLSDDQLEPLFAALTCRHSDTALRAANCLGLLGDARATGALLQLSREDDTDVRLAAIAAMERAAMGPLASDSRLSARLEWLLDDDDANVRSTAFDALAALYAPAALGGDGGGKSASSSGDLDSPPENMLELAALALRSKSGDIRLRALPILIQFGGSGRYAGAVDHGARAHELLGHALDDEDGEVRGEAFATLWAWHSGKSQNPEAALGRGAACRHADVRLRVVAELARLLARLPAKTQVAGHWADDLLLTLLVDTSADVGIAALDVYTKDAGKRDGGKKSGKSAKGGKSAKAHPRYDAILKALGSPRPEVRAAACKRVRRPPLAGKSDTGKSKGKGQSDSDALIAQIIAAICDRIREDRAEVHTAAIEAYDRLSPDGAEGFALAFSSEFYGLRVRACELCGKRRDTRAIAPAQALLTIAASHPNRPSAALRQRTARALADVGAPEIIPFYTQLLDDDDAVVREMASRGLATSCRPGGEMPLVHALSHADLPVRSWVAEGLARLGDDRALPVLSGTLSHDHRPIRLGAIMGFAALGPDGVRGLLQGLDDDDGDIQDLVFAIIAARDYALARAGEAPDLLLSALSSAQPHIRFAAARIVELRIAGNELSGLAQELVGPRKPERAADMKDWPDEDERTMRLQVLIDALASDHPAQRYAAAQVLSLRGQALAFWREAGRLIGPTAANRPRIPYTNWEDDAQYEPRKRGWLRSLFVRRTWQGPDSSTSVSSAETDHAPDIDAAAAPATGAATTADTATEALTGTETVLAIVRAAGSGHGRSRRMLARANVHGRAPEKAYDARSTSRTFTDADAYQLAFGTYAGLVRQAPSKGQADQTHRVRQSSIDRLAELARQGPVGHDAVLPTLRRALSDPHHLVRKAAMAALIRLYPDDSFAPYRLALGATAADVGRSAVDALVAAAQRDDAAESGAPPAHAQSAQAAKLAEQAVDAPVAEVRKYAVSQIQRLYDAASLEPWLIALASRYADVRLSVVDRLIDSTDPRVSEALGRALESDHDDLRLKAAVAMARRGDTRTADVLAGMLRGEDQGTVRKAIEALVALAHARPATRDDVSTTTPGNTTATTEPGDSARTIAARTIAARLEDYGEDGDSTGQTSGARTGLIQALGRIASPTAGDILMGLLTDKESAIRSAALSTLMDIARINAPHPASGTQTRWRATRAGQPAAARVHYHEALALAYTRAAMGSQDADLRRKVGNILRYIEDPAADDMLATLVEDRDEAVRVTACETLAFRAEHLAEAAASAETPAQPPSTAQSGKTAAAPSATVAILANTLRTGRRELVLPAAAGLASRGQGEAFQALLLVFKAGQQEERKRAVLALGMLGDRRALEELEPLVEGRAELEEEDAALVPDAVEALGRLVPHLHDSEEFGDEHSRVRATVEHLAKEASGEMRQRAITGLRHTGDDAARALIERMAGDIHDRADARLHATRELGLLSNAASEPVLADILSDGNAALRRAARDALEHIFPGQKTRTSMLALASPHRDISAPAASFLARRGDPALLVAHLGDIDSADVRARLRRGLIRRGQCPADEISALLTGGGPGPCADAAWIVGTTATGDDTTAARKQLSTALETAVERAQSGWQRAQESGNEKQRQLQAEAWRACLWAAGRIGAAPDGDIRQALTMDVAPETVRAQALRLLAQRGNAADADTAAAFLSDPAPKVRVAAAAAVAQLAPEQSPALLRDTAVADAAVMGPIATAALTQATTSAKDLLDQTGPRQVILPILIGDQRTDALADIASEAAASSGDTGKGKRKRRSADEADSARLVAIAALGRIGTGADSLAAAGPDTGQVDTPAATKRAEEALEHILNDPSEAEDVRKAAFKAIRRLQRRMAKLARYEEMRAQ